MAKGHYRGGIQDGRSMIVRPVLRYLREPPMARPARCHNINLEGDVMRRYLVSAIALALASASMASMAATPAVASTAELATTQLPRNVRPSHYDVAVVPHADKMTFDGKVTVTLDEIGRAH